MDLRVSGIITLLKFLVIPVLTLSDCECTFSNKSQSKWCSAQSPSHMLPSSWSQHACHMLHGHMSQIKGNLCSLFTCWLASVLFLHFQQARLDWIVPEVTEVMKYKAALISHRFCTFSFCVFKHITRQLAFPKTWGTVESLQCLSDLTYMVEGIWTRIFMDDAVMKPESPFPRVIFSVLLLLGPG